MVCAFQSMRTQRVSNASNFLPDVQVAERQTKGRNKVKCLVRGYEVPATPEERVRQRVLDWLMNEKAWSKDNLRLEWKYDWISDPSRSHIRPDIELLDEHDGPPYCRSDRSVLVVVECKNEDVPLSEAVYDQAKEYAIKAKAPHIWVTNGKEHGFLEADGAGWKPIKSIPLLDDEEYEPPSAHVVFPDVHDTEAVAEYLHTMNLDELNAPELTDERDFALALYKVMFEILNVKRRLPYSHNGVHLLEYSGTVFHQFSNRSGGSYYTRYADVAAATRSRVEAMSVAINMWSNNEIRLCVGVSKMERRHHALQLDFATNCQWDNEHSSCGVWHDGKMSQVKSEVVLEAVREAGRGDWIVCDDYGKEWVYLGELPKAETANWDNSKDFVANLLHYCIIRTNLREAVRARKIVGW